MTHKLYVQKVTRWSDLNEYEGQVQGELDAVAVTCYFLASPVEQWDRFRPDATLDVDAWIERSGQLTTMPPNTPKELDQVDGVIYEITGTVAEQEGELLEVSSVLPLQVDLDQSVSTPMRKLKIGQIVRVRGILKVDLVEADEG